MKASARHIIADVSFINLFFTVCLLSGEVRIKAYEIFSHPVGAYHDAPDSIGIWMKNGRFVNRPYEIFSHPVGAYHDAPDSIGIWMKRSIRESPLRDFSLNLHNISHSKLNHQAITALTLADTLQLKIGVVNSRTDIRNLVVAVFFKETVELLHFGEHP